MKRIVLTLLVVAGAVIGAGSVDAKQKTIAGTWTLSVEHIGLKLVLEQKKTGRFARPLNNRLSSVSEWMRIAGVVPPSANAMLIVSLLFLAVCAVNLVGLLLGKFLARGGEVGVRRALGASRTDIFVQHIVECELVAIVGGVVGIALSLAALAGMNAWLKTFQARGEFFRLDAPMILLSIGLALAAGFVAGAYPAWRTCRLPPAEHLKI